MDLTQWCVFWNGTGATECLYVARFSCSLEICISAPLADLIDEAYLPLNYGQPIVYYSSA